MPPQPLLLVLTAACIHATWNLLAKRVRGGMEVVWLYSCVGALVYGPWALIEYAREWPRLGWREAGSIAGSCFWQLAYFVCLQNAYRHGDLSLVYPVARGTGPLVAALGALAIFGEVPSTSAWLGIGLISGGVLFFLRAGAGIGWGMTTGLLIGIYSLWDKNAVSALHLPPVLMEWTTDLSRAIVLAPLALRRRGETARVWRQDRLRLILIGAMNPLSYILVLTALTMAPLHRVAPLREISIVLGAILGARFLGEKQGWRRLVGAIIMVAGVLCLTGCSAGPPAFQPKYERGIDLRIAVPPPLPPPSTGEEDEADIQFRAAQTFYRAGRWNYAIPALSEALDHDDDRQDIRYYLAACLVMAGRDTDSIELLDELLETPWAPRARALYARVLYRAGKGGEARVMAAEAAREDFDAAGWLARYDLLFGPATAQLPAAP